MHAENPLDDSSHFSPSELKRFDSLMAKYLNGEASDGEQEELRRLTENGYEKRFDTWLDRYAEGDLGTAKLSDSSREEILSHIIGSARPKTRWIPRWWSWAAVVLIALGGTLWFASRKQESVQLTVGQVDQSSHSDEDRRVLKGKQYAVLPDGSHVLMNVNSELSYSLSSFQGPSREVHLKGEAFFDVVHDVKKPFLVKSGNVVTRVLGTAFNVNSAKNEVVVTVSRGLVEVGGKDRVYAKVRPDEQIKVNTETEQFQTATVSAKEEITWKNAYLVLDNLDLTEAGNLIGDHYGVKLIFKNTAVTHCRMTASFLNEEDLTTVLTVLTQVIGASYRVEGRNVFIEGGGCD